MSWLYSLSSTETRLIYCSADEHQWKNFEHTVTYWARFLSSMEHFGTAGAAPSSSKCLNVPNIVGSAEIVVSTNSRLFFPPFRKNVHLSCELWMMRRSQFYTTELELHYLLFLRPGAVLRFWPWLSDHDLRRLPVQCHVSPEPRKHDAIMTEFMMS